MPKYSDSSLHAKIDDLLSWLEAEDGEIARMLVDALHGMKDIYLQKEPTSGAVSLEVDYYGALNLLLDDLLAVRP